MDFWWYLVCLTHCWVNFDTDLFWGRECSYDIPKVLKTLRHSQNVDFCQSNESVLLFWCHSWYNLYPTTTKYCSQEAHTTTNIFCRQNIDRKLVFTQNTLQNVYTIITFLHRILTIIWPSNHISTHCVWKLQRLFFKTWFTLLVIKKR